MKKVLKELIVCLKIGTVCYIKQKDKYNQTVKEMKINPRTKTYEIGSFTWTTNCVNGVEFGMILDLIELMGYKEEGEKSYL